MILDNLLEQRARVHRIRLLCVPAMRNYDNFNLKMIENLIGDEVGIRRRFCRELRDTFMLLRQLTPGWEIESIAKHGEYQRVTLMDVSGRGRDSITNKFVHYRLDYILCYMIVTAHLTDINAWIEELSLDNKSESA